MAIMLSVRAAIEMTHAAVQTIAEDAGVDILHIKGPAVHPLLGGHTDGGSDAFEPGARRSSVDADVWVRPSQLTIMQDALQRHGWVVAYHFDDGSPFRHAMTLKHDTFAPLDLHRRFPGIGLAEGDAFEVLWECRTSVRIAGIECTVPDLTAQRLILILHGVRARRSRDVQLAHDRASAAERDAIEQLAGRLGAEVPLAAATGRLESFADRREYALWRAIRDGERSRARMWVARVQAESTLSARVRTGLGLVAPKADRLQVTLGRRPTVGDWVKDLGRTVATGARELTGLLSKRTRAR